MPPSDPNKTIFGAAYDVEFGNISTAITSKYDSSNLASNAQAIAGVSASTLITPASLSAAMQTSAGQYWVDSGAVNAMVITPNPALVAYAVGQRFTVKVAATTTSTTVNINVNALGNKLILNPDLTAPAAGAILINSFLTIVYDGTRFQIQSPAVNSFNGTVAMAAITGASTLTINGLTAQNTASLLSTGAAASCNFGWASGILAGAWNLYTSSTDPLVIGTQGNTVLSLATNNAVRATINGAGNLTLNVPTSGTALAVNGLTTQNTVALASTGAATTFSVGWAAGIAAGTWNLYTGSTDPLVVGTQGNTVLSLATNNTIRATFSGAGNATVNAPSSGVALTVAAGSGTHSTKIADSANASFNAGFLELPVNTQNANYTTVLADSSKSIYHSDGIARTYTIDSNANVAYPIGTVITFINDASGAVNVTIAITADTLQLSPNGTTGSRTLAQFGRASAHKVTATKWIISGTSLT